MRCLIRVKILYLVVCFFLMLVLFMGCTANGKIVNRNNFETELTAMKLIEYPYFKVYYGGSVSEIPLKQIKSIFIYSSDYLQYKNELYYRAEITLKNNSSFFSTDKDDSYDTKAFVSVQNSISGKRGSEIIKVNLSKVSQITIITR